MTRDYNKGWSEGWGAAKRDSAILAEKYPEMVEKENEYYD